MNCANDVNWSKFYLNDNCLKANEIQISSVPVATKEDIEKIKENLKNQKYFLDLQADVFMYLLQDKFEEEMKKIEEEIKRNIKKEKIANINDFTKSINKVIFTKNKETIILWKDGTKTKVTCQEGDTFDKEKGFALCIIKYIFGNIQEYNNIFKAIDFNSEEPQIIPNIK